MVVSPSQKLKAESGKLKVQNAELVYHMCNGGVEVGQIENARTH